MSTEQRGGEGVEVRLRPDPPQWMVWGAGQAKGCGRLRHAGSSGSVSAEELCGMTVFMQEAAEVVDPFDQLDASRAGRRLGCRQRSLQVEAAVWPGGVVVLDVDAQDAFEVPAVADQ